MNQYDLRFDHKINVDHCDYISWSSDFALYLEDCDVCTSCTLHLSFGVACFHIYPTLLMYIHPAGMVLPLSSTVCNVTTRILRSHEQVLDVKCILY